MLSGRSPVFVDQASDGVAALDHALGALSQFFISDGTLGDTLLRVAQLACKAVDPGRRPGQVRWQRGGYSRL
jgi:hypothetical protein